MHGEALEGTEKSGEHGEALDAAGTSGTPGTPGTPYHSPMTPFRITILVLLLVGAVGHTMARQTQPAGQKPPAVVVPPGRPTVFLWPNGAAGSEKPEGRA